jgi:hypothetical protein
MGLLEIVTSQKGYPANNSTPNITDIDQLN